MHVCLVSPMFKQTPHSYACLCYQSQVQADPMLRQIIFHACLSCQSYAQIFHFMHAFFVSLMLRQAPSCIVFLVKPYAQANTYFLQVLISRIQAKPYNSALANYHLLVKRHTPGSDTLLYGFQQHILGPNDDFTILTTPSPFHKLFLNSIQS